MVEDMLSTSRCNLCSKWHHWTMKWTSLMSTNDHLTVLRHYVCA